MWAVGICERCGTVAAFRTTTPIAKALMRGHSYYCPVCVTYKLLKIRAVPNAERLEAAYNDLRIGVILDSDTEAARYDAQEDTTKKLIEKYRDPATLWWLDEDRARFKEERDAD